MIRTRDIFFLQISAGQPDEDPEDHVERHFDEELNALWWHDMELMRPKEVEQVPSDDDVPF